MTLRPFAAGLIACCLLLSPAPAPAAPGEAVDKLQQLLRIDTTNPPGNEAEAAALVAGWLRAEGIEPRLYESAPGRVSVVARLEGSGEREPLLLLNHLDVVTADPASWKHPPFSGVIEDGALWGRGALDMKGLGVMQLVAFLELKRRGVKLKRDVIFCAVADEESGGEYGAAWLLEHHPEAVACSEVLNEGGSGLVGPSGAALMGIQTAERGHLWLRVTASGEPGHGSQHRPDAATHKLLRALARLEAAPPAYELIPETKAMLEAIAGTETGLRSLAIGAMTQPWLLPLIGPRAVAAEPALAAMLGNTWNTTVLSAGSKVNVVPGTATAEIDVRILPGQTPEAVLAWFKEALADPELHVEATSAKAPSATRERGPLYEALAAAAEAEYPGIRVVPVMTPGGG
ncbi:MAG: M20/M25/M40 family metallo-hydrolase, partial [Candidatus Sericytochromatia bacterium]